MAEYYNEDEFFNRLALAIEADIPGSTVWVENKYPNYEFQLFHRDRDFRYSRLVHITEVIGNDVHQKALATWISEQMKDAYLAHFQSGLKPYVISFEFQPWLAIKAELQLRFPGADVRFIQLDKAVEVRLDFGGVSGNHSSIIGFDDIIQVPPAKVQETVLAEFSPLKPLSL